MGWQAHATVAGAPERGNALPSAMLTTKHSERVGTPEIKTAMLTTQNSESESSPERMNTMLPPARSKTDKA